MSCEFAAIQALKMLFLICKDEACKSAMQISNYYRTRLQREPLNFNFQIKIILQLVRPE